MPSFEDAPGRSGRNGNMSWMTCRVDEKFIFQALVCCVVECPAVQPSKDPLQALLSGVATCPVRAVGQKKLELVPELVKSAVR